VERSTNLLFVIVMAERSARPLLSKSGKVHSVLEKIIIGKWSSKTFTPKINDQLTIELKLFISNIQLSRCLGNTTKQHIFYTFNTDFFFIFY